MDPVLGEWQARIRAAAAARAALRIRGGGTKDFYGRVAAGGAGSADAPGVAQQVLDTTAFTGIVNYEPTELVITARCGTPLRELEATMRENGQMLAFEPPHFGDAATLGGCVASGLSGPRRPYAGSVRDLVLGVRVLDGAGEDLRFGGQVMKNVAGFDVARLMAGSLGTLALITEVSVKCLPLPRAEATRAWELPCDVAIRRVNEWAGQPLPLSASAWDDGRLVVRFSGAGAAVEAAVRRLGGEALADADGYWESLREQTHPFFGGGEALWRLSVKSTAAPDSAAPARLLEWGGALRWVRAPASEAARLRAWAQANGGHATLFRGGAPGAEVFTALAPAALAIHRRLKAVFDPGGLFEPGRMYAEF
jgi:glycolate oxidase FAD binding subunit